MGRRNITFPSSIDTEETVTFQSRIDTEEIGTFHSRIVTAGTDHGEMVSSQAARTDPGRKVAASKHLSP